MDELILALDIGGANIKAACNDGNVWSQPFAVWKEKENLAKAITEMIAQADAAGKAVDVILVTMTAELCDCYEGKREGVSHVLDCVLESAAEKIVWVYLTGGAFVKVDQAKENYLLAGASNWDALGRCMALAYQEGRVLLIDMGSTTTDLILIEDGKVKTMGKTDCQRLGNGELVYVGCKRTALMALGGTVEVGGDEEMEGSVFNIMAEFFADIYDVLILLGIVEEDKNDFDSPDDRARDIESAWGRIVRMIGGDKEMISLKQAKLLALGFFELLGQRLVENIERVLDADSQGGVDLVLISGEGSALIDNLFEEYLQDVEVSHLSGRIGEQGTVSSCCVSMISLYQLGTQGDE